MPGAELAWFYFQSLRTVSLSERSNSAAVTRSRAEDFDGGMGPGTYWQELVQQAAQDKLTSLATESSLTLTGIPQVINRNIFGNKTKVINQQSNITAEDYSMGFFDSRWPKFICNVSHKDINPGIFLI